MKLRLNKEVILDQDCCLESKPHWITINDKIVLDSKYTLWDEIQMVKTIEWLHYNTDFDKYSLHLFVEDCVAMTYE